jgi:hypothetical protein
MAGAGWPLFSEVRGVLFPTRNRAELGGRWRLGRRAELRDAGVRGGQSCPSEAGEWPRGEGPSWRVGGCDQRRGLRRSRGSGHCGRKLKAGVAIPASVARSTTRWAVTSAEAHSPMALRSVLAHALVPAGKGEQNKASA